LCVPTLEERHWRFFTGPVNADGAQFAANLLRAGVADPADWKATQDVGSFLERTLQQFIGGRASMIDSAFDVGVSMGTNPSSWHATDELNPKRVLIAFRVAHTVGWVNLTPALDLLRTEHECLPAFFYHSLRNSLARWFRVFDVQEARCRWENWMEMRDEDVAERKAECERDGAAYEGPEMIAEPTLPESVRRAPKRRFRQLSSLKLSEKASELVEAAKHLNRVSRRAFCPRFDDHDREELFSDTDAPIPITALAFGEHDVITEFLNMELDNAGQVEAEPWPILKMDGTDPQSIRRAFHRANVALDTLAAAARVFGLVPGFERMH